MSRATDFQSYLDIAGFQSGLVDMTPTQLSTTDATPDLGTTTATGPWVRCGRGLNSVHAEISSTTFPTGTLVVETSNTQTALGPVVTDTLAFSAAGQGMMSVNFSGCVWARVRCTAISGSGAYLTATMARS